MADQPIRVVHYLNQFFGGVGGEDKADGGLEVRESPVGPGLGLQQALGDRGRIVGTLICGDNYFNSQMAEARAAVLEAIRQYRPDVVVAGPAFKAGRYGLACGEVCKAVIEEVSIPAVTAMFPENPAVSLYHRHIYILPTGDSAATMRQVLPRLMEFAYRLAVGEGIGPAEQEGYIPRGERRLALDELPAAKRAMRMLKAKLSGQAYRTEVPVEISEPAEPAPPVEDLSGATVAIVTTSGLVPQGNPDGFRNMNESRWRMYSIENATILSEGEWEPVHGGYDASFARKNPHVVVPLDVLRQLEAEKVVGQLYPAYVMTVGVGTPVEMCRRMGEEIADELHRANVSAAIFTSN
ncbi:MAG: glycine/betaine/sarcosine/D-proline family reductase selenoprotein B [Acidobacteria bacterium]|nr:glycine/betaine/sarcosine/D-proline family reductase selenoprotein B [Acidobacteriota bacterium]